MAHPQSSFRGLWAKKRIDIGANELTANSTALVLSAGIKISDAQTLTGNSTGLLFGNPVSALPAAVDNAGIIGQLVNSTGAALFINSTATDHVYLATTSIQPT